jgi:ribosome-associated toxin RatA of RatAB toxin-antitoxin module
MMTEYSWQARSCRVGAALSSHLPEWGRGLVLCLLVCASAARAQPDCGMPGWAEVAVTPSGPICHRAVQDSAQPMVMIAATLPVGPDRVRDVVTDYDHFAEFIPYLQESRVLARDGTRQWVYHRLRFPAPVAERAYVISSSETAGDRQRAMRIEWRLSTRTFVDIDTGGAVRPDRLEGFWDLRPRAEGNATEARYAVLSEPGGLLPEWLVTRLTDRYVQQVMAAVRERCLAEAGVLHRPDR